MSNLNIETITKDLKDFAKHNKNVLLSGDSGVGKTEIIKSIFNELYGENNWKYFNGPTMNVYTEFVGIPNKIIDNDTGVSYLENVMPKDFALDQVSAIFIDEINRANKKVRNAVFEIMLNKSINGKPFKNLKVVWAAINEGDEYDVERLDKALLDRFDAKAIIPFEPNYKYFKMKYDKLADISINWWSNLDDVQKKHISPRRLDKLLDAYNKKLRLIYMVPKIIHKEVRQLTAQLKASSPFDEARNIYKKNEKKKAKDIINKNNFSKELFWNVSNFNILSEEFGLRKWMNFWIPLVEGDNLIQMITKNKTILSYVLSPENINNYKDILIIYYVINRGNNAISRSIELAANDNSDFSNALNSELKKRGIDCFI